MGREFESRRMVWVPLLLYVLTWMTTSAVGILMVLVPPPAGTPWDQALWAALPGALMFSVPLMTALTAHELGHLVTYRMHGMPGSLPLFLPMPLPPFGTLGAVIVMRGRVPSRSALFDIGASGPFAGLLLAVPFTIWGLTLSEVDPTAGAADSTFGLGSSLLFEFLTRVTLGELPDDAVLNLHPMAFAGWSVLFVTGLNLLPLGQLDGGHVIYSLIGPRMRRAYRWLIAGFVGLTLFYAAGWFIIALILIRFGRSHPPTLNDRSPLEGPRRWLALATIATFLVTFVPRPFSSWRGLLATLWSSWPW